MGEHSLISPEKFDVVVVGTGLVESLVAAYVVSQQPCRLLVVKT